jgi:demethylmenaquinone methyltransferase/2-methoxy-6-polyprenyl-1,4-benzoquinol methylase
MSLTASKNQNAVEILDTTVSPRDKAKYVRKMFDDIAPRYDLLNSLLSAGTHHKWRSFATRCAAVGPGNTVLDLCSGTGDWAVLLKRAVGGGGQVVGADFSLPMLRSGDQKYRTSQIERAQADAVRLPFAGNIFDAVTVAFGIRNVSEIEKACVEITRVLKPGGRMVCLEFAEPHPGLFKTFYSLHSRYIMPRLGGAVSGRSDAYTYLPESVARFKTRAELADIMTLAGLSEVRYVDLMFGLVCVHVGVKPNAQ